ncbi:hypothetical protein HPB50_018402 [Hyalomma asiaticum]|uniref:Uncharacterized protein n=1 Tax=Hyalomma asiaticum TaxID=266040 RepID=A0ACB7SJA7_HYAAI|nr:hypothetical protein HPB50_018402 [Hyalomma asiaticum]
MAAATTVTRPHFNYALGELVLSRHGETLGAKAIPAARRHPAKGGCFRLVLAPLHRGCAHCRFFFAEASTQVATPPYASSFPSNPSSRAIVQPTRYIPTYLGGPSSGTLPVWPVWDQNVLVCSVTSSSMAQRLLGDIQLLVGDQQLPSRGHAKASGEICLAVVTFEGTKLPRFIFYHSVVAYVRPYKKTIPACTLCGTIGHRPSACPRPTPGRCTRCGTQVQVTPQGLTQHECNPTCLLCSGPHETGARGCLGKYRKPAPPSTRKPSAPPSAGLQAASQAKPGSPLNTPATPPPVTAVHYPPLVTASPQLCSRAGMTAPQPLLPSPPPPSPELSALRKQNALLQRQIAALT